MAEEDKKKSREQRKNVKLLVTSVTCHIDEIAKDCSAANKKFLCGLVYKHYKKMEKEPTNTKK